MSAPHHGQDADRDADAGAGSGGGDPLEAALGTLRRRRFEPPTGMVDRAVLHAVRARAAAVERERTSLRRFAKPATLLAVVALSGVGALVLVQRSADTPSSAALAPDSVAAPEPLGEDGPPDATAPVPVRFVLPAAGAHQVAVAGEFNGWDSSRTLLNDDDGDGVFHTTLSLERGVYAYMFVVDGERWVTDPFADAFRDDGFGNRNAVVRIP